MDIWALIYNPTSGRFKPRMLESIDEALRTVGIKTRWLPTRHIGHATVLAREVEGVSRVAVYGGDGTLNEAANGLLGRDLPLVFLPGGTANVMAWELGLPLHPVRAALAQARSLPRPMWPGMLGERCFLLMAGFGFDGGAVYSVSARLKDWIGKGAYVVSGVKAWMHRSPSLRVTTQDGTSLKGSWVVAARARHYGGRFVIHPEAGLACPKLGLVVVERGRILPFLTWHLGLGRHRARKGIALEQHLQLLIECDRPIHAQVDGDYYGEGSRFEVGLAPHPLLLCFP